MYPPKEDSFFLSKTLENFFLIRKNLKGKKFLDVRKVNCSINAADSCKQLSFSEHPRNQRFLDMGSGSGIQAETLAKFTEERNITCVDIDKEAVTFLKHKGFHAINSNLFSKIKGKFDFIVFNPPYLPEHEYDKAPDTTGGKLGDETILRFLKQAKKHLNKDGKIFLLLSSLTPRKRIHDYLTKNFQCKKLAEKKLFFEILEILVITF